MLAFRIAAVVCGIPLGIWLGIKICGIAMSWIKYGLKSLKPPKED